MMSTKRGLFPNSTVIDIQWDSDYAFILGELKTADPGSLPDYDVVRAIVLEEVRDHAESAAPLRVGDLWAKLRDQLGDSQIWRDLLDDVLIDLRIKPQA